MRPARQTGANLGFEDKLWMAADKLRGTMDAAEYKHVVLGLIFLKYISDAFADKTSGEGEIRRRLIEADLMDCMLALPGQLFYTTQIPACLWFLTRSKAADSKRGYRNRQGETLLIDARNMGALIDRTHRELSADEMAKIARTYHAWRGEAKDGVYQDRPGFCKSATLDDIASHDFVLTPGRYVGAEAVADDGIPFNETLEAMAQALFKSWFVDFDPVIDNALAAGNAIPDELKEKAKIRQGLGDKRKSLPDDIRQLFSSEFAYTEEMGWIPNGWEMLSVGEVSSCFDNRRIPLSRKKRERKQLGTIPYYGATSIMDYINEYIFNEIFLLIGEDGSVVKEDDFPFTQYIWGQAWVNNHFHALHGINKSFASIIDSLYECIRKLSESNKKLYKIQDALLPRLLSGEIRVPNFDSAYGGKND